MDVLCSCWYSCVLLLFLGKLRVLVRWWWKVVGFSVFLFSVS